MSTKRLFFALDLSEKTLDRLTAFQDAVRPKVPDGVRVRWTPRENIHLTLKFLGSHESDLVEEFAATMDELVADLEPFELTIQGVGAFPHPRHPRILWVGADRDSSSLLASLHRRAEEHLGEFGVDEDEHSFKAHATIGRVKSSNAPKLDALRPEEVPEEFGTTAVEEVTLYESELDPSGATYTVLHRSRLGT